MQALDALRRKDAELAELQRALRSADDAAVSQLLEASSSRAWRQCVRGVSAWVRSHVPVNRDRQPALANDCGTLMTVLCRRRRIRSCRDFWRTRAWTLWIGRCVCRAWPASHRRG